LIRQLLAESLILCVAGGLGGWLLAWAGLAGLVRLSPPDLPRVWEGIHLDVATLAFTVFLTLMTGLLFGLLPAWQASNPALGSELTEGVRCTAGLQRGRLRSGLVVAEVALSIILLVGAGLMLRSLERLLAQDFGFDPEQVATLEVNLPGRKYPTESDSQRLFGLLLARVASLPGVLASGGVFGLPLSGTIEGQDIELVGAAPLKPGELLTADYAQVSPGYFTAMRIPILQGRNFSDDDTTNAPLALIVSEAFIRQFGLGTNVLGRRLKISDSNERESEIIGVAKDVKGNDLANPPRGAMYRTYKQFCRGRMTLVIRTRRELLDVARAVRVELDQLDKDLPIENARTMTQLVEMRVAPRKLSVRLMAGFAGAALALAVIGLYGVLAGIVTQRTQEIGIRIALGARTGEVISLVIGQGMKLVLIGIVIGIGGALALMRVMRQLLFEVTPTDPATFAGVTILLLAVATLACWGPARRATNVDPMVALRAE
jgi:predicted permease